AFNDSIPKISFGKFFKENDKLWLPVAVHAHHGLMDGLHVAKFIEKFQYYLDNL
ncbi:MAG TPA: chloramphenicol acetyltransferase, partial [Bacteroidales bacterium]|nr:chloramphenicol acetyltransferase [Bacteroidales bacterium]